MAARKDGKQGHKSDKLWRDAIMVAVKRQTTGGKKTKKLSLLADKLIERALEGDITAMKEIGDRLDGRPAQSVELCPSRPNSAFICKPRPGSWSASACQKCCFPSKNNISGCCRKCSVAACGSA